MSWKTILKIDMDEANRLGRKYASDDADMREQMIYEAEQKTDKLRERVMRGIDTFEEQSFSPSEISSGEELKELEKEFAFAYVYDTMFGRVSLTVTMDGKLLNGYFDGREIASTADATKLNKEMLQSQEREYAGETQRSQIGYAETPDEYYYN
tara:strand:- start:12086 stop:12544 length:459 start_codon:yes stop_codon:yes gene_type:complete